MKGDTTDMTVNSVLVVGGGVTGTVAGLALAQRGVRVTLVERTSQWQGVGHGITVQGNALKIFREIGALERMLERAQPFTEIKFFDADGTLLNTVTTPRTGGADLPPTMGALRSDLQSVLVDMIGAAGVDLRLGLEMDAFETVDDHVDVRFSDGSTGTYDLVIAADGIKSKTRAMLGMPEDRRPSGMGIWRVVTARKPHMTTSGLFYNGPQYKAGYTPISDELCYAYVLTDPVRQENGLSDADEMKRLLEGYHGDFDFIRDNISDGDVLNFQPIEWLLVKGPWHRGRVVAIGDAVHACPPLIAQGAAQCAEDAWLLADYLTRDGDIDDLLTDFEERRKPRVQLVVDASLQLVDWELHPDTPGANPAQLMGQSLAALAEPA